MSLLADPQPNPTTGLGTDTDDDQDYPASTNSQQPPAFTFQRVDLHKFLGLSIFFLFGIAGLAAWNTWITAASFFAVRFKGTPFAGNFQSYFSFIFMFVNFAASLVFLRPTQLMSLPRRILSGFASLALTFMIAASMAGSNMSSHPYAYTTLFLVGVSGVSSAFLSGVLGLAASYPPIFTTAISSGQGFAGLVPALVQLILVLTSKNDAPPSKSATALYFSVNVLISLLAIIGYITIPNLAIRPSSSSSSEEGYQSVASSESSLEADADLNFGNTLAPNASLKEVFPHIRVHSICVMLNFLATLAVFPGITSSIEPVGGDGGVKAADVFRTFHFFCFNLGDWAGRSIPGFSPKLQASATRLTFYTTFRFLLFPLFLFCNIALKTPTDEPIPRLVPLWFGDLPYFVILFVFAFSNGWLGTSVLMLAPKGVDGAEEVRRKDGVGRIVGDVMVVSLAGGLVLGSVGSFVVRWGLCGCNPFVT